MKKTKGGGCAYFCVAYLQSLAPLNGSPHPHSTASILTTRLSCSQRLVRLVIEPTEVGWSSGVVVLVVVGSDVVLGG